MRFVHRFTVSFVGAALVAAAACGPAGQSEDAGDAPEVAAADLNCYLARGTMEEAAQRPSPLGETTITLGGQAAKLCYGRPSARERTVMGELVPFGDPWRAGANEATALHLAFAAEVGGIALEPGSYSVYVIPGESEWEIVVNGTAERWGIPISPEVRGADIGSFSRPSTATAGMVETLTYSWEPQSESMGHLVLEWENTRVEIPIARGM